MVYVIFEDGTDLYWARARSPYLNFARNRLPESIRPQIGPDATGLGWVYQYVLHAGYYCPSTPRGSSTTPRRNAGTRVGRMPRAAARGLEKVRAFDDPGKCPLGDKGASLLRPGPRLPPEPPGLVSPLRTQARRRCRGGLDRRLREAVSDRPRSHPHARVRPRDEGRLHGGRAVEQRRGRLGRRDGRERVHGPEPWIPPRARGPGEGRRRTRHGGRPVLLRDVATLRSEARPAAALGSGTGRERRSAGSWSRATERTPTR